MVNLIKWSLADLIQVIVGCIENKFDCIIFIEGLRGVGKSTLGYKLGLRLHRKGISFNPYKNLAYSREDVITLLANLTINVILADEMINVSYNRDFYEHEQKQLLKALNMYRDSYNVFIGCIPKFIDLDVQMRRLCKIKITVLRRGVALIQTQIKGIYRDDPWDIKNNLKIEEKKKRKNNYRTYSFSKLTTVRGILHFNDLTPKQRETYEAIKKEKRNKIYSKYKQEEPKTQYKTFLLNIYQRILKGEITKEVFNTFCLTLGKKPRIVRSRLNEMLKEQEINKTLQEFLLSNKEKEKRDKKKQSQFIIKPALKQEESNIVQQREENNKQLYNTNSEKKIDWSKV